MKRFKELFETPLTTWADTMHGVSTPARNARTTPPHNEIKIEFKPSRNVNATQQSPDDPSSKAPKILPYPIDTITDELLNAYGHLEGVQVLLNQCLTKNTVIIAGKEVLFKELLRKASRAKKMANDIYKEVCKLSL